jgi:hypothetical protein
VLVFWLENFENIRGLDVDGRMLEDQCYWAEFSWLGLESSSGFKRGNEPSNPIKGG